MGRPTIRNLAVAASVSVSTVNRVITGQGKVREGTMQRVLEAAEEIGFYGLGAIRHRVLAQHTHYDFKFILLQVHRSFYQALGRALKHAAANVPDANVTLTLSFIDDLSPDKIAARIRELGVGADAIGVVAAEHPRVSEAIELLRTKGVPVFSLVSPLSGSGNVGFIGLDSWKVGRTAAWAFDRMCRSPGKIGILVGNPRYRCQEMNESGFRSYFREHGSGFELLEPLLTFESSAVAREMTEKLLAVHPDLQGLFISGGGITGALAALRESDRSEPLVAVGYELMDETKTGLLDGTLTLVISHPLELLARETIAAMIRSRLGSEGGARENILLPFDMYTSENL